MISMLFDISTHFGFRVIRNDVPVGPVLATKLGAIGYTRSRLAF
jgi:hypothetical protein